VAQKLSKSHDYATQLAPKTFITNILFIDWLEAIFLLHIAEFRAKFANDGPAIVVVDVHSIHVTPRVIELCGDRKSS
jgi:hypothetical protein